MTPKHYLIAAVALVLIVSPPRGVRAQVGNDNPAGPAGIFNGEIATAGSYDPYTGNVTRSVTDISVAAGVGIIPLNLTRTYNSRRPGTAINAPFGLTGWTHNYSWSIDDSYVFSSPQQPPPFSPTSYSVNFPDGRSEWYSSSSFDSYYRGNAGVRNRFIPLDVSTNLAYLVLEDNSRVEFKGTRNYSYDGELHMWSEWYTYAAQALIDRCGLRTTFTYNTDGTLQKVTEPAGRYIQFYYTTVGSFKVVDHVTASDGRAVQYFYIQSTFPPGTFSYVCLDHIVYYGDATWTARYRYQGPNTGSASGIPLLSTCDDPMYVGPMKRIGYVYKTTNNADGSAPAYGQLLSENYYDGTNIGTALSTLTVNNTTRTETRADTKTRTFTYASALLMSCTDFRNISASQTYDAKSYVNSITDRNGHTTDYTLNALTGHMLMTTFPLTPNDTPSGTPRGTVTFTYGSSTCPDPNNQDATNPYYLYSQTDEGGHTTVYLRDANKRVGQINYPDGGSESFTYNSFGQVLTHLMKTGGTESFSYDARGLRQTYRDAYHQSGNPSAWYQYDALDRVSGVTDALGSAAGDINHTTNYTYNSLGQVLVTTHPVDPTDGQRHTITNIYNPDGTLATVTDELGHVTSSTHDNYRRVRSVTSPGHDTPVTAYTYYDATGTGEDYTHADASVTHATAPGGERIFNTYDENYRKMSTIVGDGTFDAAKTSYGYDNNGNVTSVTSPNEQPGQLYAGKSSVATFDERNRVMSVTDALNNAAISKYDAAGRKASVTKPNGQVITYDTYDAMNRLLQQTVKQTPDPDAVTKYTYYTSGMLHTMQDARLVANNSSYNYNYVYDQMGRKTSLTYPPDSGNVQRSESWHYDTAGRADTFTNRSGTLQTFSYDNLNRRSGFTWNDGGITPAVSFVYDPASRVISITNAIATISRTYFNDHLLKNETEAISGASSNTVSYTYNADANRATIQYPGNVYSFAYNYTGRSQLKTLINNATSSTVVTFAYDPDGNLTTRIPDNATNCAYSYDVLDRVTHISHSLSGSTRSFDYGYDSVSNCKWVKRDGGTGDVFDYDKNYQTIATLLNIASPDTTSPGPQTITYDANGNRVNFAAYGPTDSYHTNNLNQYSDRNGSAATYDSNGNLTSFNGSTYIYDAQNRLISATKGTTTETFAYDGINRQVKRTVNSASTYNVWDGWSLLEEYQAGGSVTAAYLAGAGGGLVKNLVSNRYYYQDSGRSTSHLADSTGHLLEWYRYDLHGAPIFYNASNTQISASAYNVRHLFTGQQWYKEIGAYDLRHRFYSPDIGRFLQADPSGFSGDATNLYRYCGNNPLKGRDPGGLTEVVGSVPTHPLDNQPDTAPSVEVSAPEVPSGGGGGGEGGYGRQGGPNPLDPNQFDQYYGGYGAPQNYGSQSSLDGEPVDPQMPDLTGGEPLPSPPAPSVPAPPPAFSPNVPFALSLAPTLPNTTYFAALNVSLIGGLGPTVSVGIYFSPQGQGLFATPGWGGGWDNSVSVTGGYINGDFKGPFTSFSGSAWLGNASAHFNGSDFVGWSGGIGIGVTIFGGSMTNTNTLMTEPSTDVFTNLYDW